MSTFGASSVAQSEEEKRKLRALQFIGSDSEDSDFDDEEHVGFLGPHEKTVFDLRKAIRCALDYTGCSEEGVDPSLCSIKEVNSAFDDFTAIYDKNSKKLDSSKMLHDDILQFIDDLATIYTFFSDKKNSKAMKSEDKAPWSKFNKKYVDYIEILDGLYDQHLNAENEWLEDVEDFELEEESSDSFIEVSDSVYRNLDRLTAAKWFDAELSDVEIEVETIEYYTGIAIPVLTADEVEKELANIISSINDRSDGLTLWERAKKLLKAIDNEEIYINALASILMAIPDSFRSPGAVMSTQLFEEYIAFFWQFIRYLLQFNDEKLATITFSGSNKQRQMSPSLILYSCCLRLSSEIRKLQQDTDSKSRTYLVSIVIEALIIESIFSTFEVMKRIQKISDKSVQSNIENQIFVLSSTLVGLLYFKNNSQRSREIAVARKYMADKTSDPVFQVDRVILQTDERVIIRLPDTPVNESIWESVSKSLGITVDMDRDMDVPTLCSSIASELINTTNPELLAPRVTTLLNIIYAYAINGHFEKARELFGSSNIAGKPPSSPEGRYAFNRAQAALAIAAFTEGRFRTAMMITSDLVSTTKLRDFLGQASTKQFDDVSNRRASIPSHQHLSCSTIETIRHLSHIICEGPQYVVSSGSDDAVDAYKMKPRISSHLERLFLHGQLESIRDLGSVLTYYALEGSPKALDVLEQMPGFFSKLHNTDVKPALIEALKSTIIQCEITRFALICEQFSLDSINTFGRTKEQIWSLVAQLIESEIMDAKINTKNNIVTVSKVNTSTPLDMLKSSLEALKVQSEN